jgi:DNA-binding transcriptional regulator PaaX
MRLHQKGYLLVELSKVKSLWDDELIKKTLAHYNESGDFKEKSLRIALDELASAGLINRNNQKLRNNSLHFCYQLSDFGRLRMINTGLITI